MYTGSIPRRRSSSRPFVEQGATAPLLLLATARPEFRAPWPMRAHHAQITLNRLNDRHTRALVAGVVGKGRQAGTPAPLEEGDRTPEQTSNGVAQASLPAHLIPDDVIEMVVKRTDGVPLFAEELTRLLLEGDGRAGGRDRAREIPATLHDSLTARLDRLGRAKRIAGTPAATTSGCSVESRVTLLLFLKMAYQVTEQPYSQPATIPQALSWKALLPLVNLIDKVDWSPWTMSCLSSAGLWISHWALLKMTPSMPPLSASFSRISRYLSSSAARS